MTGASALASLGDQVEQADPDGVSKGRAVAFLGANHLEADVAAEIFVLDEPV